MNLMIQLIQYMISTNADLKGAVLPGIGARGIPSAIDVQGGQNFENLNLCSTAY